MSDLEPVPVGEMDFTLPPALPEPSAPPPLTAEYSVRVSALEPERIWKLMGSTLWMGIEEQPNVSIPLSNIHEVRLAYEPSRTQTNRFRCYLYRSGAKIATIQNDHYKGFMSFEDRSASYNFFIQLLIPRIAALSPHCAFKTGTSALNWWAMLLFILAVTIFLLLTTILLYTAIGSLVIIKLLIIAYFIPTLVRWFRRNRAKVFSPKEIPIDILPNG